MSTLYEISDNLDALADLLSEVGGDVSDEQADAAITEWLAEIGEARDEKLDAYAALIRETEARGVARAQESERLAALARTDAATVKRLKDRLLWFFKEQGLTKVQTERFRLSVAQNGGKPPLLLMCEPYELLPEYQRVKISADIDALRSGYEAGDAYVHQVAAMGERGSHLRIA